MQYNTFVNKSVNLNFNTFDTLLKEAGNKMQNKLKNEIKYLTGVGPKRAELLSKEININTYEDLLHYYPYKYVDRSKIHKISEINSTYTNIQLKGVITGFRTEGGKYRQRLVASFTDNTGVIDLIWFQGIKWIRQSVKTGKVYLIFGKPGIFNRSMYIAHPEIEDFDRLKSEPLNPIQPLYSTTEKLKSNYISSKTIQKLVGNLLKEVLEQVPETMPAYLVEKLNLLSYKEALLNIHFPRSNELLNKSIYRFKFEELFYIQLSLLQLKYRREEKLQGIVFNRVGDLFNNFYYKNLKFELTGAQKRVVKEIRRDLGSGKQMNRLLQGDVGSGKTLVALMSMLIALDNHYQACFMAPTEILANQHYATLMKFVEGLGIRLELLTGSSRKKEREITYHDLKEGKINILVGTHALLEDIVQFKKLGLVIIDEQHRFGVAQRARLWKKSIEPPHVLVMTATPIPRTLAMTIYGDLDVSVIDEMPPGRKPVQTIHFTDSRRLRLFGFMKKIIERGQQIYVVYPLIKESEKMDYKDLEDGYEGIVRALPPPKYAVSCVHGKMKTADKDMAMQYFVQGKTHILVATTVIEVGVDVPNATLMVIESAERFGLSQLHQLRGRVGRDAAQSFCILMTADKLSNEAQKRINTMVSTTDGFEIAEADLELRGPGDLEGTQQSGVPLKLRIADLGKDGQVIQYSRNIAREILLRDPMLKLEENEVLKHQLKKNKISKIDWSFIS